MYMSRKKRTKDDTELFTENETVVDPEMVVDSGMGCPLLDDGQTAVTPLPQEPDSPVDGVDDTEARHLPMAPRSPLDGAVSHAKKRVRVRKKGQKKLSVAVLCSNIGFSRFV